MQSWSFTSHAVAAVRILSGPYRSAASERAARGASCGEAMDADGSALLIIRAWVEPLSEEPLRAQLRMTGDVSLGIERTVAFARADDVCDAVRDWLAAVVRDAGRPEP